MAVAPGDAGLRTDLRDAFLAHYAAALCVDSVLFAEVDAVLDALDARALPWGIVTNKAMRYTSRCSCRCGSRRARGTVICGDTTPHAKPHPAPLIEAASRLGVAPQRCVYVGDARRDIDAGKAAGMATLVARWGYIEPDDAPDDWSADGLARCARGALLDWLRAATIADSRSAGTRARVDEQPLGGLARRVFLPRAPAGSRPAASRMRPAGRRRCQARCRWPASSDRRARMPSIVEKPLLSRMARPAVVRDQQRLPAVGLRRDAGEKLGVELVDRALVAGRRRRRPRGRRFGARGRRSVPGDALG